MRSLTITLLILLNSLSHAGIGEAEKVFDDYARYYENEYPAYLKAKYDLNIHELYWMKVQDYNQLADAFTLRSKSMAQAAKETKDTFYSVLTNPKMTSIDKVMLLRSQAMNLKHIKNELRSNIILSKQIEKKITSECTETTIKSLSESYDPRYIYMVPNYSFTANKAPQLDMALTFNISYGTDNGDFQASVEVDAALSEEEEAAVFIGAGLVTGAVIFITGGVSAGAASVIFAGSVAVFKTILSQINSSDVANEYIDHIKTMRKKYDGLNNKISKKHSLLAEESEKIFTKACNESIGTMDNGKQVYAKVYQSVTKNLIDQFSKISKLSSDLIKIVENEEKLVLTQIQNDIDFLQKINHKIDKVYKKNMQSLFTYQVELDRSALTYFVKNISKKLKAFEKQKKTIQRTNQGIKIWEGLIRGGALYNAKDGPKSINWSILGETATTTIRKAL